MSPFTGNTYQPVDSDSLLSKERSYRDDDDSSSTDSLERVEAPSRAQSKRLAWTTGGLFFFMALSIGLFSAYVLKRPSDVECGLQTTVWSPANEAVEYETINFDNAFAHQTVYRGPPTPELETAWQELWFYGGVRVPDDKLSLLNRTFDLGKGKTLRPVEDEKGGVHSLIEVFHQLHCLNLIRQYTWKDWYFRHQDIVRTPVDLLDSEVGARMHVDHCIEALRIALMCHGDTTPYLVMVDPTAPNGMRADFSPYHKCRKFESLRDWVRENEMSSPPPFHWEPKVSQN